MATRKTVLFARRIWEIDTSICRGLNRTSRIYGVRPFFAAVSRLGDGMLWYALIALIALIDTESGYLHAAQMLGTGAVGLLIYKLIKSTTVRPRPYASDNGIDLCAHPLDQYSFPSGHTLHAVCFSVIACAHYPMLYEPLFLFATLVALSRMVLGLHYPTDVVAGAAIGATLAGISLSLYS